jgi:hypothetical protein
MPVDGVNKQNVGRRRRKQKPLNDVKMQNAGCGTGETLNREPRPIGSSPHPQSPSAALRMAQRGLGRGEYSVGSGRRMDKSRVHEEIRDALERIAARLDEIVRDCTRELGEVREQLGAERARRYQAESERDELRQELEQIRPSSRPWWVVGLLVIVVVTTLVVLSLGAIFSPP